MTPSKLFSELEDFPDLNEINRLDDEDLEEYFLRVESVFRARNTRRNLS